LVTLNIILIHLLIGFSLAFILSLAGRLEGFWAFLLNAVILTLTSYAGGTLYSFILLIGFTDYIHWARFFYIPALITATTVGWTIYYTNYSG